MLTEIYCRTDDFCKEFKKYWQSQFFMIGKGKTKKVRESSLTLSEVITIIIYFHLLKYRTFKDYYTKYILAEYRVDFPDLVSYN